MSILRNIFAQCCMMYTYDSLVVATLKDVKDNKILCIQRERQLESHKLRYKWEQFKDLAMPSGIDVTVKKLPSDEQFGAVKGFDFLSSALASKGIALFKAAFTEILSLAHYEDLATTLGTAPFAAFEFARWTRDEEFGRQILNGVNPIIIERCIKLPPNFPVAATLVEESLVRGLSLEDEMKVCPSISSNYDIFPYLYAMPFGSNKCYMANTLMMCHFI